MKYNKRLKTIILPEEGSKLKFKINHMIKSPFTIYFDIEIYAKYFKKINHEKLLKPYLVSYILICNYNGNFSKKCQIFTGFKCISKMLYNLLTKDNNYINDIEQHFNKEIEDNPDLSKFNKNICHLCNKKIFKKHCHYSGKILGFAHDKCNLQYIFPKDNVNNKYLISVFAHNAQNFDNSFLIKALNNIENVSFSALPRNSNKFISLKIKNFIFKDSFLFLNKSFDYLTKTIDDKDRISLKQEFGENYKLLTKKEYILMIISIV